MTLFATIEGGVLTSRLDAVRGCSLMTTLDAREQHPIIDLHANFFQPVTLGKQCRRTPRGTSIVINCARYPQWNGYPAILVSLVASAGGKDGG